MQYVVVLSLWSPRSPQSADFNEVLARVTHQFDGQIVLAQVDVDTNAAIAQALEAKGVPMVVGLVKGQPVPLFQGTLDEAEVLRYFSELDQGGGRERADRTGSTRRRRCRGGRSSKLQPIRDSLPPTRHSAQATSRRPSPSTRSFSRNIPPTPRSLSGWQVSSCSHVRPVSICRPRARLPPMHRTISTRRCWWPTSTSAEDTWTMPSIA